MVAFRLGFGFGALLFYLCVFCSLNAVLTYSMDSDAFKVLFRAGLGQWWAVANPTA